MKKIACFLVICIFLSCIVSCSKGTEPETMNIYLYYNEADIEIDNNKIFSFADIENWVDIDTSVSASNDTTAIITKAKGFSLVHAYITIEEAKSKFHAIYMNDDGTANNVGQLRINNLIFSCSDEKGFVFLNELCKQLNIAKPQKIKVKRQIKIDKINNLPNTAEIKNYFENNGYYVNETTYFDYDELFIVNKSRTSALTVFTKSKDLSSEIEMSDLIAQYNEKSAPLYIAFNDDIAIISSDNAWEKIISKITK